MQRMELQDVAVQTLKTASVQFQGIAVLGTDTGAKMFSVTVLVPSVMQTLVEELFGYVRRTSLIPCPKTRSLPNSTRPPN